MDIQAFARLSTSEIFFYLAGGATLIATPPLIGTFVIYYLFHSKPDNGRVAMRRIMGAIAITLSIAFALGATGIALLQPASPDIFIALLILCLIFGLLGAGKLYWGDG